MSQKWPTLSSLKRPFEIAFTLDRGRFSTPEVICGEVFLAKINVIPSDTKLLLTKNYSEIIIFEKLRISRVISGKSLSFPEI